MCLLAVYVIVHGCVKVYERLSFIYVAIYLNKKSTPEMYFCVYMCFFPHFFCNGISLCL